MTEPKRLNVEISAALAELVGAQAGQCWENAIRAMQHVPGALYVEGFSAYSGAPVAHAWLETETDIIDVTLYQHPAALYRPVLTLNREQLRDIFRRMDENQPGPFLPLTRSLRTGGVIADITR